MNKYAKLCLLGIALVAMTFFHPSAEASISSIGLSGFSGSETVTDFNSISNEQLITNQYTGSGVNFSGALYGMTNSGDTHLFPSNGGGVIASNWIYSNGNYAGLAFTASFNTLMNRVGFYLENWPVQTVTVEIFNGSSSLGQISFTTSSITAEFKGLESTSAFDKLIFINTATDNGFYAIDDFRYESTSTVPVPPSFLLLGSGMIGLAGVRLGFKK